MMTQDNSKTTPFLFKQKNGIGYITLNRPSSYNAF